MATEIANYDRSSERVIVHAKSYAVRQNGIQRHFRCARNPPSALELGNSAAGLP